MLSFINSLTKTLAPNLAVLLALPMGFEEFSCVTPLKQKENTHPHNDLKTAMTRKVNHYFWRLVIYLYMQNMMYTICVEFPSFHTPKKHFITHHAPGASGLVWTPCAQSAEATEAAEGHAETKTGAGHHIHPNFSHFLGRFVALLIKSPTACKQSLR